MNINKKYCLAIVVVIIIFIIAAVIITNEHYKKNYSDYLEGFWVAPDTFCSQVGVNKMYIFINDKLSGYIVIESDGNLIASNKCDIKLPTMGNYISNDKQKCKFEFEEPIDILPDNMFITLSIAKGTMTFSDSEELYCYFIKDLESSLYCE